MKGMSNTETRAWFTIIIEVLKANGINWKDLDSYHQSLYLENWARAHNLIRHELYKELTEGAE